MTIVHYITLGVFLFIQVGATAYFAGKIKATLNGTVKLVEENAKQVQFLHERQTDHLKEFHTKGRK